MRLEVVSSDRKFVLELVLWMGGDPVQRDLVKIEVGGASLNMTRHVFKSDDDKFNLRLIDFLNTAEVEEDSTVIRLLQEND